MPPNRSRDFSGNTNTRTRTAGVRRNSLVVFLLVFVLIILLLMYNDVRRIRKQLNTVFEQNSITAVDSEKSGTDAQNSSEIQAGSMTVSDDVRDRVDDMMAEMSLDEKLCQLLFVTPEQLTGADTVSMAGEMTEQALEKYPVGGIIYFEKNLESREQISEMIANTQSYSKIPLFIGVDEEGGRVARISRENLGFDVIEPMKAVGEAGDPQRALEIGRTIAGNLKPLGFNVDFAPVADVLLNADNTEIGDRSFGNDPNVVAEMVKQEVISLQENGISAALKHFPGHGSAKTDSHDGYSESTRTMEELRETEFLPFQAGIGAGADFVLVSHITMVGIEENELPASLSKMFITDILKNELKYEKLVITDSLRMGAITDNYSSGDAAVMAIEAGADILLMPQDIDGAFTGLKNALESERIRETQVDERVRRILQVKIGRDIIK